MAFNLVSTSGSGGNLVTNGDFATGWASDPTLANADFTLWPSTTAVTNGDFEDWSAGGGTNLLTNGTFTDWTHGEQLTSFDFGGWSPQQAFFNSSFDGGWNAQSVNLAPGDVVGGAGGSYGQWQDDPDLTGWFYGAPQGSLVEDWPGRWLPSHTTTLPTSYWGNQPGLNTTMNSGNWYAKLKDVRTVGNTLDVSLWMFANFPTLASSHTFSEWNPRFWITNVDPADPACDIRTSSNITGNIAKRDAESFGDGSGYATGYTEWKGSWKHEYGTEITTTGTEHWVVMTLGREGGSSQAGITHQGIWSLISIQEHQQFESPDGWEVEGYNASYANLINTGGGLYIQTLTASYPDNTLRISQAWGGPDIDTLNHPTVLSKGYWELTVDVDIRAGGWELPFLEVWEKESDTKLGEFTMPEQADPPVSAQQYSETIRFANTYTSTPPSTEALQFRVPNSGENATIVITNVTLRPLQGVYPTTGSPTGNNELGLGTSNRVGAGLAAGDTPWQIYGADDDGRILPVSEAADPHGTGSAGINIITESAGTTAVKAVLGGLGQSLDTGATYTLEYTVSASNTETSNALYLRNGTNTYLDLSGVVGTHRQGFVCAGPFLAFRAQAASADISITNVSIKRQWTSAPSAKGPDPTASWRNVAGAGPSGTFSRDHYCIDNQPDGTNGAVHMKRAANLPMKLNYEGSGIQGGDLVSFNYTIPTGATTSGDLIWTTGGSGGTAMTNAVGSYAIIADHQGTVFKLGFDGSDAGETTLDDLTLTNLDALQDWAIGGSTMTVTNYIFPSAGGGLGMLSGAGDALYVAQNDVLTAGTMYRLVYDITEYTSGTPAMFADFDGATASERIDLATSVGTDHEVFFEAGDTGFAIGKKTADATDFAMDNVRVYEATPTSWTQGGTPEGEEGSINAWVESTANPGRVRLRGTAANATRITQPAVVAQNTLYKFNYTVGTTSGGTALKLENVGGIAYADNLDTSTGAKSVVFDSGTTNGSFGMGKTPSSLTTADIEFDDLSLEILGPPDDWTVANQDVDNFVERDGSANQIRFVGENAPGTALTLTQSAGLVMGTTYRLTYTVEANAGAATSPLVWDLGSTTQALLGTVGTHSYAVDNPTSTGVNDFILENAAGAGAVDAVISSLSLREDLGTVELPNPEFGNLETPRRLQVGSESLGGEFFVYDRGAEVKEYNFSWNALNKTQLDDIFNFWDTVEGMKTTFDVTFDDWRPTQFGGTGGIITLSGVRFATSSLEFDELANGQFSLSMVLRDS